jgi:hypothetical protein
LVLAFNKTLDSERHWICDGCVSNELELLCAAGSHSFNRGNKPACGNNSAPNWVIVSNATAGLLFGDYYVPQGVSIFFSQNVNITGNLTSLGSLVLGNGVALSVAGNFYVYATLSTAVSASLAVGGVLVIGPGAQYTPLVTAPPSVGTTLTYTVAQYASVSGSFAAVTPAVQS